MEGLREDNEMSGKCTRPRWLSYSCVRAGSSATRNCSPFHFGVAPRCARTSGVPEISFLGIKPCSLSGTRSTTILHRVLITLSSDPLYARPSCRTASLFHLFFLIQLQISVKRKEEFCLRQWAKIIFAIISLRNCLIEFKFGQCNLKYSLSYR